MKNKPIFYASVVFWSLLLIFVWATSALVLEDWIKSFFANNAPKWFEHLITLIYPRLAVERHRFEVDFFVLKANQVVLRFLIVNIFLLIIFYWWNISASFKQTIQTYWNKEIAVQKVEFLRKSYAVILAWCVLDWAWTFETLDKIKVFYEPVFLLKILNLSYPSLWFFWLSNGVLLLCCFCIFFDKKSLLCSIISAVLFFLLQGYLMSFHKIDHTYATFNYCIAIMPILLYHNKIAHSSNQPYQKKWALTLIQVMIVSAYFMAGVEKLLIGGFAWFSPQNLQTHLILHETPLGLWVAQYTWLCVLLSICAVLFEIGFLGILFFEKYKYFFLTFGVLFHLGTLFLLDAGGFPTPWTLVYIFWWENDDFSRKNKQI